MVEKLLEDISFDYIDKNHEHIHTYGFINVDIDQNYVDSKLSKYSEKVDLNKYMI